MFNHLLLSWIIQIIVHIEYLTYVNNLNVELYFAVSAIRTALMFIIICI